MIVHSKQYSQAELALALSSKRAARFTGTAYAGGLTASYSAAIQAISISSRYVDMTFETQCNHKDVYIHPI